MQTLSENKHVRIISQFILWNQYFSNTKAKQRKYKRENYKPEEAERILYSTF